MGAGGVGVGRGGVGAGRGGVGVGRGAGVGVGVGRGAGAGGVGVGGLGVGGFGAGGVGAGGVGAGGVGAGGATVVSTGAVAPSSLVGSGCGLSAAAASITISETMVTGTELTSGRGSSSTAVRPIKAKAATPPCSRIEPMSAAGGFLTSLRSRLVTDAVGDQVQLGEPFRRQARHHAGHGLIRRTTVCTNEHSLFTGIFASIFGHADRQ